MRLPGVRHGLSAVRAHVLVSGHVQGVGFRWSVERVARGEGLGGWVRNRRDGRVEAALWFAYGGKNREVLLSLVNAFK